MDNKFYITTPIYYINDKPHVGTAVTTIVADVLARFWRQQGEDVLLVTGTDENSQKTVDAAAKKGEDIVAYTDRMAKVWEETWEKLGISNTDFIRTTEPRHVETVLDLWSRIDAAGDIYKDMYTGLYCKGCEEFKKEEDLVDGLCPEHKVAPEAVSELNYFFRLSNYQEKLLELYENRPDFVVPENRFRELKAFVEGGLEDISISRETRDWGIPVPKDEHQKIYVWFDALINYVSAVGVDWWEQHPADLHTVGKNITRFHAVIWPAMLLSAGLPLPRQVLANGFLTIDGTKISKSLGNAIDPLDLTAKYGNDALRYFLLREIPFGEDGDFSEAKMKDRYNGDLANGLGNFASRVSTLAEKEGPLSGAIDPEFAAQIDLAKKAVERKTKDYRFHEALAAAWTAIAFGDKYVNDKKVWAITDDAERKHALYNLVALLQGVAAVLLPYIPASSQKIAEAIRHEGNTFTVKKIDVLFPRI